MPDGFNKRMARRIVRAYPRAWRERYQDEMLALLESSDVHAAQVIDLARGCLRERARPSEVTRLIRGFPLLCAPAPLAILGAGTGWVSGAWLSQWGAPPDPLAILVFVLRISVTARALGPTVAKWRGYSGSRWPATNLGVIETAAWCVVATSGFTMERWQGLTSSDWHDGRYHGAPVWIMALGLYCQFGVLVMSTKAFNARIVTLSPRSKPPASPLGLT